jgi:hypothetical protein
MKDNNLEACYASDVYDGSNSMTLDKKKGWKAEYFDVPMREPKIEGYDTLQGTLSVLPEIRTFPKANGTKFENVEQSH